MVLAQIAPTVDGRGIALGEILIQELQVSILLRGGHVGALFLIADETEEPEAGGDDVALEIIVVVFDREVTYSVRGPSTHNVNNENTNG